MKKEREAKEIWVMFIGSGYECVKLLNVGKCRSFPEAFEKAEAWYKENGNFHYCEIEIKDGKYIAW